MSHIESLPTAEHRAEMRVLLGTLKSLLARQTPEQLAAIWKGCFSSELAFYDVDSGFHAMQPEEHLSLQPEEHLLAAAAAAFMDALTAAVEGPHAAAAEEPQTSSAECEDV